MIRSIFLSRQAARYLLLYWLALVGMPLLLYLWTFQWNLRELPYPLGHLVMALVGFYVLPFGFLFGEMANNAMAVSVIVFTGYSIVAVGMAAITTWKRNKSRPVRQ